MFYKRYSCDDGNVNSTMFRRQTCCTAVRSSIPQYTPLLIPLSLHTDCWLLNNPFLSVNSFVSRFPQAFYIIPSIDTVLVLSIYYMSNSVLCTCMAACLVTFCFIYQYIHAHTHASAPMHCQRSTYPIENYTHRSSSFKQTAWLCIFSKHCSLFITDTDLGVLLLKMFNSREPSVDIRYCNGCISEHPSYTNHTHYYY